MLKIASVGLALLLVVLVGALGVRQIKAKGQSKQPPGHSPSGANDGPSDSYVVIDGRVVDLSRMTKSVRQRARALVEAVAAADKEVVNARRELDLAKLESDNVLGRLAELRSSVNQAEAELAQANQQREAARAQYIALRDLNDALVRSGLAPQALPSLSDAPETTAAQMKLNNAQNYYAIYSEQHSRQIQQALLRVKNLENRIASASAAWERARADLFELLPPDLPK